MKLESTQVSFCLVQTTPLTTHVEQCFGDERDAKKIDVKVGSETIPLVYESSTIYLSHIVKSGANLILIGAYEGPGKITLSTTKKAAES